MAQQRRIRDRGPFRADQLGDDDRYELVNGHPIYCQPSRREHAAPNLTAGSVIDTDPAVEWAGVDAGFSPEPGTLRAPDVAVAGPGETGWLTEAPPLAVEYAGVGQDEQELAAKIRDLLSGGSRYVWVVRLVGPRRVEVHEPGAPPRTVGPGQVLTAPNILRNPVPVEALFDRTAAHEATLHNLLARRGYASLDAVRQEGREEGHDEGLAAAVLALLASRGLEVPDPVRQRILGCRDRDQLTRWLLAAVRVEDAQALLEAGGEDVRGIAPNLP